MRGRKYCFTAGPHPLHQQPDAQLEPILTKVQAQALVNGLDFSKVSWTALFRNADQETPGFKRADAQGRQSLIDGLAAKTILAYRMMDLSAAREQAPARRAVAAPVAPSRSTPAAQPAARATSSTPPASTPRPTGTSEPTPTKRTDFAARKGVQPASLQDAVARLKSVKTEIERNGVHRKYTAAELVAQVQQGTVANERFHVRLMESAYMVRNGAAGMLGMVMETELGKGAKYWSTTFDQAEDADCIAELHCRNSGIEHKAASDYVLVVIDTDKTKALAGCMSIVPTFAALGNFANTALPTQFEKEETDVILTDAFQKSYAAHHKKAVDGGFMKNAWDKDSRRFDDYLSQAPLSMDE